MARARARDLLWLYTRIGNTTFGGGDPTMAALQTQLLDRKWVKEDELGLVYGLARATPGTNILAYCAGTGWLVHGWLGAVLATTASSLPTSILVAIMSAGFVYWRDNRWVMAAIGGMLAAATGLMCVAAFTLLRPNFTRHKWFRATVIFALALLLILYFGFTPVRILALAAIAGFFWPVVERSPA